MSDKIYVNPNWVDEAAFNADSSKPEGAVWGETAFGDMLSGLNAGILSGKEVVMLGNVDLNEKTGYAVDASWAGKNGENVSLNGKTYVVGVNAFATLKEAIDKAEADEAADTIVINGNVDGKGISSITTDITLSGTGTIEIDNVILAYGDVTFKDADIAFSPIDHNLGINVRNGATMTVDNSEVNVGYFYIRGSVDVVNGSTVSSHYLLAPGASANEEASSLNITDSEVIIDANAYNLDAKFGSASDSRTININLKNGKLTATEKTVGIFIDADTEVFADTDSLITAVNQLDNQGSITISAGESPVAGSKQIIDAGTFSGNNVTGNGVNITVDANGDIFVSDPNIAVNASWATLADNTQVKLNGKTYVIGVNAFANINDAVAAASATGETTITLAAGTYAEDITLDARSMEQKGDINFVAADDAEVILTGKVTIGYYEKRVGSKAWNANVAFGNIIFDQAAAEAHSIDIQQVKDFSMTNCTVIGDGEYGVSGTNVDNGASIIGCIFTNAGIQSAGNFGTNLLIDQCVFNTSRVNIQSGNSVLIKGSTFNAVLNDSNVGDSFYCVRSNDCPIFVEGTTFNIDSELTEVAADQAKWGVLWQRREGGTKWQLTDIEVNYTDAAMAQTELLFNKNGTTTAANEAGRVTINGITSTTNNIDDILARSEGMINVDNTLYDDGSKVSTDKLYVNSDWTAASNLDSGLVFGVNAFNTFKQAAAKADTNGGAIIDLTDSTYTFAAPDTSDAAKVDITTPGMYTIVNGNGLLLNHELEVNEAKADGSYVLQLGNEDGTGAAHLTATKLTLRKNASLNVYNSRLDFNQFQGGSAYLSVYFNSSINIKNSVVGYNPAKTGIADPSNFTGTGSSADLFGPRISVYGTADITDSVIYTAPGQTTHEGFDILGNAVANVKNSTIYSALINVGTASDPSKYTANAEGDSATLVFDNSKAVNTQYRGDYVSFSGIRVGSATTAGTLNIINGSEIDFTAKTFAANDAREKGLEIGAKGYVQIKDSSVSVSKVSNAGVLTVSGNSTVNAGNIYNTGELFFFDAVVADQTISGDSTGDAYVYIEGGKFKNSSMTDLFAYLVDTTITDADFNGSGKIYTGYGLNGNNEWDYLSETETVFSGNVNAATKTLQNYAKLNVAADSVLSVNYYGDTSNGNTAISGEFKAETYRGYNGIVNKGGKITAGAVNLYGTVAGAKFTVNGTINAKNMLIGFDTMKQADGQGGWWYIGGANNVFTVSGANASVAVTGNVTVNKDEENFQATVNINDKASFQAATLTNNGIINIAGGNLVAGTLANNGTITIDAKNLTSGSYKIVDTDSFTGRDIIVNNVADGMFVIKGTDGDITITDGKYYVDPSWTADSDLADGLTYGINAFGTADELFGNFNSYAARNTSDAVFTFADGSELNTAAGKTFFYTDGDVVFSGANVDLIKADRFYLMDTLIANGEAADKAAADAAAADLATVTIAAGTTVKTNTLNVGQAIDADDVEDGKVTRDFAAVNLVINGTLDQGNLYVNSYSTVTVSETGKVLDNNAGGDSHIRANGKLIVNGTGKDGDVQFASNWYRIRGGEMLFNSTNATTGTLRLFADTDNAIITDDSQSLLKADASKVGIYALELDENGENKAIFTNGSDITVTTTIDNGNIVDIIDSTVTANKIDNSGEIYANNSTVTAKTMTGNGILFGSGKVGFNTDTNSQRVLIGGYFDENGKMVYHEGEANRSAMTIGDVSGNGVKLTSKEFRTNNTDITLNADVTADLGSGVFMYFRKSTLDLNGNDLTISSGKFLSTGLDITGSGTVTVDSANDQPCFQTFASSIGADVTFKASKQLCIYEDLTLYGTMINSGNAGNGVTHVGFDDEDWSDGTVFTVSGSKASFTQTGNPGFTIHGADETQDIAKSALVVKDGANFTTDTTVTNYGDIVVDGANFTTAAVVNLGSFSVSGTSVINIGKLSGRDNGQGYTDVTINLAAGTVLAEGTAITVTNDGDYGKVVAAGSITVTANAFTNFDQISVSGDLNITDVVLPAGDEVVSILDGKVVLDGGKLAINGITVDAGSKFAAGNNIYQVSTGDTVTVQKVASYTEITGSITAYQQTRGEYMFTLTGNVTGGTGSYEYSVKVFADAALTQELDATGGLQFFLANDPTVDTVYAVVTVSDAYSSKVLAPVTINVNDCTAPKFDIVPLAAELSAMDGDNKANDVLIKFTASDNFAVTSYIVEFNGEKLHYTVSDPAQGIEIVRKDLVNGDYAVKVTALDAAGNKKVSEIDFAVNVQALPSEQPGALNDFNGDGKSDIIVSEPDAALFKILSSPAGDSEYTTSALAIVEDGWTAIGTGYLNNDRFADILLRNDDTGELQAIYITGTNGKYTSEQEALNIDDEVFNYGTEITEDASWSIIGLGDVNGDGIDDIIVEKESIMLDGNGNTITDENGNSVKFTEISAFESTYNGEFKQSSALGGINPGEWQYIATADMDGDNKDDIVWMNKETQLVGYWSSQNRDAAANAKSGEAVDPTWKTLAAGTSDWSYAGIGDFDGDGKSEILWQHDEGLVGFWQELDTVAEDGTAVEFISLGMSSEIGKDAVIESIGNYGGDANRDDILWRTANDEKKAWIINSEDYGHKIITVAY